MFNRNKKVFKQFDWLLFLSTLALCVFGLFVLRSATASPQYGSSYFKSQLMATVIGFAAILFLLIVDTDFLKRLALPIYLVCIGLLVLTLVIGFGEDSWGARSWMKLGPLTFQPSEFSKIGMILAIGALLDRYSNELNRPVTLLKIGGVMLIPLALIARQPDFGTMMVFAFFFALMLFYAGLHWGYIGGAIGIVGLSLPIIYSRLDTYQKNRILNFLDPSRDPLGSTYQSTQGTIAIGSGQLLGRGYMQGPQTMYGFIPEQQTDYIFAVLAEEFGFIGGVVLICTYTLMLFRMLSIAKRAKDVFGATVSIGIAAMIFVHIFENIGMTIGLMPVTGIPLPFMSSGGTFQLINLISVGLVLSIGAQRRPLDFNAAD